jgi:hypothetical protein
MLNDIAPGIHRETLAIFLFIDDCMMENIVCYARVVENTSLSLVPSLHLPLRGI